MTYSAKDLKRALSLFHGVQRGYTEPKHIAQGLADVRREALEEAAMEVKRLRGQWDVMRDLRATHSGSALNDAIIAIRALKDDCGPCTP